MHGNVWEWCEDWLDADYYSKSPGMDPHGPSTGSYRVSRGGSCLSSAYYSRVGRRHRSNSHRNLGFRACLPTGQQ